MEVTLPTEEGDSKFVLNGFIHRSGHSTHHGHYIAYAKIEEK